MPAEPDMTVVTIGGELLPAGAPLLHPDDLAALRGDGVFETLLVRGGTTRLLDAHLERLARSARLIDLPAPDAGAWRRAVALALSAWDRPGEATLRLVYSRGRERGSDPTGYVMITPLPQRVAAARREGVAAVTLNRGLAAHAGHTDRADPADHENPTSTENMPWLLAGAKTLSYAVNMAALRHAAARGADDVIFVSTDGYVLEGPRSTVIVVDNHSARSALLTPPLSQPILRGTTQQALFRVAAESGYDCRYHPLTVADLAAAEDIWLVSSITLAARVHTLDGRRLNPRLPDDDFAELVEAAVGSAR